jgi:hypothetical protein
VVARTVDGFEPAHLGRYGANGQELGVHLDEAPVVAAVFFEASGEVLVLVDQLARLDPAGAAPELSEEAAVDLDGLPVEHALLRGAGETRLGSRIDIEMSQASFGIYRLAHGQDDGRHGDDLACKPVDALHLEDGVVAVREGFVLHIWHGVSQACDKNRAERLGGGTMTHLPLRFDRLISAGAAIAISVCFAFECKVVSVIGLAMRP